MYCLSLPLPLSPVGSVQHPVCAREREAARGALLGLCQEAIAQPAGLCLLGGVPSNGADGHLRCVLFAQGHWAGGTTAAATDTVLVTVAHATDSVQFAIVVESSLSGRKFIYYLFLGGSYSVIIILILIMFQFINEMEE